MRLATLVLFLIGAGVLVAATMNILAQQSAGAQPWGAELADNIIFARAIPFVLAFGVAAGMFGAAAAQNARATKPGQVRRFSRATVVGHWIITIGFLLALPTGVWQYFGGIVDVELPTDLYLIYRVHYIGAAIILFSITYFLAYWWQTGHHGLVVPRGQWKRHFRGLIHELPPMVGREVARLLRLDTSGTP